MALANLGEVEEVPRRIYWIVVLTAAAAGTYVVYRLRFRSRDRQLSGAAEWFEPASGARGSEDSWVATPFASTEHHAVTPEAAFVETPTEEVATVVATMEAPLPAPVAKDYDGNGASQSAAAYVRTTSAEHLAEPVQIPRRRGLSAATLAVIATAVGVAAIGLGAWAVILGVNDDPAASPASAVELEGVQEVVSLLSRPSTERIPLQGSEGRIILVVGARGYGVLVLDGLSPAPVGKSYQAWVIKPNAQAPESAAIFSGGDVVVPLTTPVPPGAAVAITLERAGGAAAPTQTPKLVATRAS